MTGYTVPASAQVYFLGVALVTAAAFVSFPQLAKLFDWIAGDSPPAGPAQASRASESRSTADFFRLADRTPIGLLASLLIGMLWPFWLVGLLIAVVKDAATTVIRECRRLAIHVYQGCLQVQRRGALVIDRFRGRSWLK